MQVYDSTRSMVVAGWRGLVFAVAVSALLVGTAYGPGAKAESLDALYQKAKAEGKLMIYTGRTVVAIQSLTGAFKKKYPGIEVDFFRGGLSTVMQRFITESAAGRHVADIVDLVTRRSKEATNKGLTQPYTPAALANYPKEMQIEGGIYTPYALHLGSFAWNTDLVKGDDVPKTWEDLLDPKWKGKMGMQNPISGGGAAAWVITMYDAWGEEKWSKYMKALAAQDMKYGKYMQVREMMASGEIHIQVVAYPDLTEPLVQKGAPVNWGTPSPTMSTYFTLSLSKFAAHPNAAKLYFNFMLTQQAQDLLAANSMLPALPSAWPEAYKKLTGIPFVEQARLESTKPKWFKQKIREFWGKAR